MNKIKIGVIFGGMSTENEVSCISGASVIKHLNKEKYNVFPIYIDKIGNWCRRLLRGQRLAIYMAGAARRRRLAGVLRLAREADRETGFPFYRQPGDSGR